MDTNQRVLLIAHPRSGSSSLYQILQLHPALKMLEEPFNEAFANWSPTGETYQALQPLDIKGCRCLPMVYSHCCDCARDICL